MAAAWLNKPTEAHLMSVSRVVGGRWKGLLVALNIKKNKIDALWQSVFGDAENACFEGLVYWKNGNASQPVTWETLLKALREAELIEESKELRKKFNLPIDEPANSVDMEGEHQSPTSSSRREKEFSLVNLMPYVAALSGNGQSIAVYIHRDDEWEGILVSPGQPKDHIVKLLKTWLDDSQTPEAPHSWRFFINVVKKIGKGKLAEKIERERFVEGV